MLNIFSLFLASYLLGSINSAIISCFLLRLPSPTTIGSGNPGATNILRFGAKKAAIATLFVDMLKGFFPIIIVSTLELNTSYLTYIGLSLVLGHIFPIFFKFKGGKGVATFLGTILAFDWLIGSIFLITWLAVVFVTRYASLSSILATTISSIFLLFYINSNVALPFFISAFIIILRHYQNVERLLLKTEYRIRN